MTSEELAAIVGMLRRHRSDVTNVEAKTSAGGLSASLSSTLSAFGNLPGGGVIILGLDENDDFAAVGLPNPAALCAALASKARTALDPPPVVDIETVEFESKSLVVATVQEVPASHKPCVVSRSRKGYLRSFDGDFPLSELDVQGFLSNRSHPEFDLALVPGATRADLDETIIADFLRTARSMNMALGRLTDDDELLYRSGARTAAGMWTLAGCLTFGRFPQQWFPNLTIQAAVLPKDGDVDSRVVDTARFDGPVPTMLSDASEWLSRHMRHGVSQDRESGAVMDANEYPQLAIRELLANAIVHRDLAPWSLSRAIEVRLNSTELTITNPGGLFGILSSQLGQRALTSARNGALVRLNQYTHSRRDRVIEALATGIPTVFAEMKSAGMPEPKFFDQGIAFTVRLRPKVSEPATTPSSQAAIGLLTPAKIRVLGALDTPKSARDIAAALKLSPNVVRRHLADLVKSGAVRSNGGRGEKLTTYRRTTDAS